MHQHATALGEGFTVCNLSVSCPGFSGSGGHFVIQEHGPVFRGQERTTFGEAKREHPLWVLAVFVKNIGPFLGLSFGVSETISFSNRDRGVVWIPLALGI